MRLPTRTAARGEDRRAPRVKVFSVASIQSTGADRRCHVLNLSLGGALVDCRVEIGSGRIFLTTSGFEREGLVRWINGSKIGVSFREPLTDEELARGL